MAVKGLRVKGVVESLGLFQNHRASEPQFEARASELQNLRASVKNQSFRASEPQFEARASVKNQSFRASEGRDRVL